MDEWHGKDKKEPPGVRFFQGCFNVIGVVVLIIVIVYSLLKFI